MLKIIGFLKKKLVIEFKIYFSLMECLHSFVITRTSCLNCAKINRNE